MTLLLWFVLMLILMRKLAMREQPIFAATALSLLWIGDLLQLLAKSEAIFLVGSSVKLCSLLLVVTMAITHWKWAVQRRWKE